MRICFYTSAIALPLLSVVANPILTSAGRPLAQVAGFKAPPGFQVTLYADDKLATDIHSLTIDARGRVVVAGMGYIKILHDTDGDRKADKATLFADHPKSGAHGMYFDGNDLICTGDNGVRRLYDTNGDGRCDKVSPVWFPASHGGHAANGIVCGPDGWFYLIAGNDAGIGKRHANMPGSPVTEVNAGAVVKFSPDGKRRQVLAHGFRNPYDMAFNSLGHMFTVDADGERVHQMPYYAPNRLFDIAQGMHHGWVLPGWRRGWSRPPWWPDNVERLVEIGRGSPTGVIAYRHRAFPKRYRDGVFSLCWTFGRVYFFPLKRNAATYQSKREVFMETTGDVGFAPTDMAVGPKGDLFIAIGGRGTRGSVFRVRWKGAIPRPPGGNPLRDVLAADQPLSSWSRAIWVRKAERLGKRAIENALQNPSLPVRERIRAVEILTELFGGVPVKTAMQICEGKTDPDLIARVLWSLWRNDSDKALALISSLTDSSEPRVARGAWEALMAHPNIGKLSKADWRGGLGSGNRRVRAAAIQVARRLDSAGLKKVRKLDKPRSPRERLAELWMAGAPVAAKDRNACLHTCLDIITKQKEPVVRLEAVRLLLIALGDINTDEKHIGKAFVGYIANRPSAINAKLRKLASQKLTQCFPSGDETLDQEMARLVGMLGEASPELRVRLADKWTNDSRSAIDIHYLLAMSQMPGKRSAKVTKATAAALNQIHIKLAAKGLTFTDQVPGILEALFARLLDLDPKLATAVVNDPAFGAPGHVIYANKLPIRQKQDAVRKLLAAIAKMDNDEADQAWSTDLVYLVASLPADEALPILRQRFADPRLTDTIALSLARHQRPDDRGRLALALDSSQPNVVIAVAKALLKMAKKPANAAPADVGRAVRTLRRLESQKSNIPARQALNGLLSVWTGKSFLANTKSGNAKQWVDWFTEKHPKVAETLPGLNIANLAAWKKRLTKIDWSVGDARRGKLVFARQNCFRCHGSQRRFGPDLSGSAQRFSREDFLTAIVDPNKDISPAYRTTLIVTKSGKVHSGIVIYQSPALTLLQTTPDTTVRIPQNELEQIQPGNVSFMPAGLLDSATDTDIADLFAYLKSMRKSN